jgi:Mg2+-importing ATPase
MDDETKEFWSITTEKMLLEVRSASSGLTSSEAEQRLKLYGSNLLKQRKRAGSFTIFIGQFKSPIILILIGAAILSAFLRDVTNSIIILAIVFISGMLGFWQERGAATAVQKLLKVVEVKTAVLRNGKLAEVPVDDVVPGDVLVLDAGDIIPADSLILQSNDLYVDEATLTGENFPVEKTAGVLPEDTPLAKRTNALFMGTHVISGNANALVVHTGKNTEFGKVAETLKQKPEETEFEQGVRHFGYLLLEVTLVLVVAIFTINVYFKRPVLDSFMFSLALAVGLTPQLLPAIISINLSKGAKLMADHKVIVKRLASIENFGSMDVLCSDKTGTLTEGVVHVKSALDVRGSESEKVLEYAYINSYFETGFTNPIDEAIRSLQKFDPSGFIKVDEIPYDFVRKRLTILVSRNGSHLMITKGALKDVLEVCSTAESADGSVVEVSEVIDGVQSLFEEMSAKGFRTLGVAYKDADQTRDITREDEKGMTFLGLLLLFDPAKSEVTETIEQLRRLGVTFKVITGDNRLVASSVSGSVGIDNPLILTGPELVQMSDEALSQRVNGISVFAEVEPNQKERIIRAMQKAGNVVGFMGDGINDASALHAADVGISVDSAVDVAKDAADFVLLEKDLGVLVNGVREGRTTFANTMKYVFMATSANFGNMFSMAGASLFLSFLPLLPKQVLLTNLMTDFPEMTIATDTVDREMVDKPHRWNIQFIRRFMMVFGLLSSVFDYTTFAVLLWILHANTNQFRTGWFVESVVSASLIVLVIRTRRPFFRSRPGKYLFITTVLVVIATVALPYTPLAAVFGFKPLPVSFFPLLAAIVVLYVMSAEVAKKLFYRWVKY